MKVQFINFLANYFQDFSLSFRLIKQKHHDLDIEKNQIMFPLLKFPQTLEKTYNIVDWI